jgi:hypothetical protein
MSFRIERVGEPDFIGARVLKSTHKTAVVMADFTQDGLDDLFVLSDAQAFVATAADVNNQASSFKVGPFRAVPPWRPPTTWRPAI